MTQQKNTNDIIIIGGGMVGAAAAIGLAQLGLTVAVVDTAKPAKYNPSQPLDLRVSAISLASENLLLRLGALTSLLKMRNIAYTGLETWEIDDCITQFNAEQINSSHLGHIIENRLIQLSLWEQFEKYNNLTLHCPNKVTQIQRLNDKITVTLDNNSQLNAKLIIGADGANSMVRQWAKIGTCGWNYSQSCMLINIKTTQQINPITWQQFTPEGPRSLLPLGDSHHASLVWYDNAATIQELVKLPPPQLHTKILKHFPDRLPDQFEVLNQAAFPLTRSHAQQYYTDNLLIIGDAAHTINPLAGQGVNLGFKDVDVLIETLAAALSDNNDKWWDNAVLKQYQNRRRRDNQLMMSAMDLFYNGFSNDILPLKLMRNAGLKLANINGPIKRQVLKYAVGI